jgi:hypothetical protein
VSTPPRLFYPYLPTRLETAARLSSFSFALEKMQSGGDAFSLEMWQWFGATEDDGVAQAAALHNMCAALAVRIGAAGPTATTSPSHGGSLVGRKPNVDRDFDAGVAQLQQDYLVDTPTYDDKTFARRFRMPRHVFDRIYNTVSVRPEFVRARDGLGKQGLCPLQRIVAALRILAYGTAADATDEYVRISETSALMSLRRFCLAICEEFGPEYGRQPTEQDMRRILAVNSLRGFPGCLGSIDCQHWKWERCPVAFAGQFLGKEKKPTVILEAIADGELWIWHAYFGCPGSLNDLNVLNLSETMNSVLKGMYPPNFSFLVNNKEYKTPYYLADGIYPSWSIFIKTLSNSMSPQDKRFSSAQEAVRKDVERAFGVLVARFHILKRPCLLRNRKDMAHIMKACIILHNMCVEARRDDYKSGLYDEASSSVFGLTAETTVFQWQDETSMGFNIAGTPVGAWANQVGARLSQITSRVGHFSLMGDLVKHVCAHDPGDS